MKVFLGIDVGSVTTKAALVDENGQYVMDTYYDSNGNPYQVPRLDTVEAHTEKVSDSLKRATWQSFGIHLGVKYAF